MPVIPIETAKKATDPRNPGHLRPETAKWFRGVLTAWELEMHHVMLLLIAAEAWDRAQQAVRLGDHGRGDPGFKQPGAPLTHGGCVELTEWYLAQCWGEVPANQRTVDVGCARPEARMLVDPLLGVGGEQDFAAGDIQPVARNLRLPLQFR